MHADDAGTGTPPPSEQVSRAEQTASEWLRRGQTDAPTWDVTIPLDEDVLRQMQAFGPGWEGKVNDVLREWLGMARGR